MRVAVIGAGPAGLATALALLRAGASVRCYERSPGITAEGTGLTLWPNGLAALDRFGAGDVVRSCGLPADGIAIHAADGRALQVVTSDAMESVGGNGTAVHRAELVHALHGLLPPDTVDFGWDCVEARTDGERATATFRDGRTVTADLVVAADGVGSVVRAASGLDAARRSGFRVWRAVVDHRLPPCAGLLTMGGDSAVGVWRLPGDRVYWFASAPHGGPRPPEHLTSWHDPIPRLLAATPTDRIVVTDVRDAKPLPAWSRGRVVLVGDAAHPSLPNMGQGTSQAFEDAAVLADRVMSGVEPAAALKSYQDGRRGRADAATAQARALARIGAWRNPIACRVREFMISAMPTAVQLRQLRALFAPPR
ncbi:FAD-dependent monooxygenase [Saccharothrix stipae]